MRELILAQVLRLRGGPYGASAVAMAREFEAWVGADERKVSALTLAISSTLAVNSAPHAGAVLDTAELFLAYLDEVQVIAETAP